MEFRSEKRRTQFWIAINVLVIPVLWTLGLYLHVAIKALVSFTILAGITLGAKLIWYRANQHANGADWWQDDLSSGWRGY